jgi:hypothetical protein
MEVEGEVVQGIFEYGKVEKENAHLAMGKGLARLEVAVEIDGCGGEVLLATAEFTRPLY